LVDLNPFKDLLIIDASTVLAGPSVGTFFAEMGAKVIKIENKTIPDVTRSWKLPSENTDSPISAYFSSINYNKEYLQLNLKETGDREIFLSLTNKADILISNFKPGDEEKLSITDKELRTLNPGLIIGKINGFGSKSDRVAYDLILQAETGFMSMNGTPESGPVKMPVAMIDVLASHHLKEGLLIALLEKNRTGLGRTVSVSLYEAAVCSLINQASNYLMTGSIPKRIGSLHPNIAPYGEIFKTSDGEQITFAIGSDLHFKKLCLFLDVEQLTEDPKFSSNPARVVNRSELFEILNHKIGKYTSQSILQKMLEEKVPAGKIKDLHEVFEDETSKELIREEKIDGILTKRVTSFAFRWE
jgi:crotonobetainyl-CoA:carnitine CoA-transferase CaiB-like acyl-CoA transferase